MVSPYHSWEKTARWLALAAIFSLVCNLFQKYHCLELFNGTKSKCYEYVTSLAICWRISIISEKLGLWVGSCCQHLPSSSPNIGWVCFGIVGRRLWKDCYKEIILTSMKRKLHSFIFIQKYKYLLHHTNCCLQWSKESIWELAYWM